MADEDIPDDSKLTRTKSRWAELGKFLTGQQSRPEEVRLPPGQHLVKNWPILDLGQTPNIPQDVWRLEISGTIEHPTVWDFKALLDQPQVTRITDIHCVTTWSRYDNRWDGVSTEQLIGAAGVRPETTHVLFTSADGYTTNMAIEDFAHPDAMIVHSWEGQPLTREHGGPVRLVVPHLYFWKSPKWLRKIEYANRDHPGFWEVRGYHNRGDPWKEERYG